MVGSASHHYNGHLPKIQCNTILTWSIFSQTPIAHQWGLDTMRPRQHFANDIFKLNENVWIFIKISLKSVPMNPVENMVALVQIMAWHCTGNKPLSEPMEVRLPMHMSLGLNELIDWLTNWLDLTWFSDSFYSPKQKSQRRVVKMATSHTILESGQYLNHAKYCTTQSFPPHCQWWWITECLLRV